MLIIEVGAAAPGGYVRAVFSRKAGGFAAPLDLMRAQLGAAAKLARRRRLRSAFSDYLVSDGCRDDAALRALEYISRPAFVDRRAYWVGFVERMSRYWGTGAHVELAEACWALREGFECGALDAPVFVPGGGAKWRGGDDGFVGSVMAMRDGVWR